MTLLLLVNLLWIAASVTSTEITSQVFGDDTNVLPAAFGDFNSDELTDLFVIRNDGHTIQILLGSNEAEPLLKSSSLKCSFNKSVITSVVPGDFNGDAFMDVLITAKSTSRERILDVHVLWGHLNALNCSKDENPILQMLGEPLAIDYNSDFIIDLFGVNLDHRRGFWIFHKDEGPTWINETLNDDYQSEKFSEIRDPHSNAFLDLNDDNIADLFVTTKNHFEIWHGTNQEPRFKLHDKIKPPPNSVSLGQSIFLDLELKGKMDHILPVIDGSLSKIFVYSNESWQDLNINFKDPQGNIWNFFSDPSDLNDSFKRTITLRGGDYNMDGYPDLLATLKSGSMSRTFLLENSLCSCDNFTRTFVIQWNGFSPIVNDTVLGLFYDIFQDGILDVILVRKYKNNSYRVSAYKNNLDYDTNFIKVMVLTGLTNKDVPQVSKPLGKGKKTFGTNLPGPRISYRTIDQDGNVRTGVSAQIPQSAHYSLNLPYTMFALGRTPNFVDTIKVGFASVYRDWPQVIPNSQMVVIPDPVNNPSKWKVQLFVTPSKVILMSGVALAGTCLFILLVIAILHWKERKIDRKERLQEAYRFHFDAM